MSESNQGLWEPTPGGQKFNIDRDMESSFSY